VCALAKEIRNVEVAIIFAVVVDVAVARAGWSIAK
jgi:hypothetical protein